MHTLGPWTKDYGEPRRHFSVRAPLGEEVCSVHVNSINSYDNTTLIAKAPEMLEWLRQAVEEYPDLPGLNYAQWLVEARAFLATTATAGRAS